MSATTEDKKTLFGSKIQELSDHLRAKVLDPAEQEKNDIIQSAEKTAADIVKKAEADAADIVTAAQDKAKESENNLQSNLRVAAHKAIDTLKIALEKEVLRQLVAQPVKESLAHAPFVVEMVKEAIAVLANDIEGEIVLSETLLAQAHGEISALLSGGMTLSDETVPNGFKIEVKGTDLSFDFTEETVVELLEGFLQKDLRKYLFS